MEEHDKDMLNYLIEIRIRGQRPHTEEHQIS